MNKERETKEQSSLHAEKFKKTGKPRDVWDLAKSSEKSIAISTELPEDVVNMMEENGPIMEARGLIPTNTSYSILQYCVTAKIIALDMIIMKRDQPNPELMKFLTKKRKVAQPHTRKKMMTYYPGKKTIPVSSVVPNEIVKLAERYSPILEQNGMIQSSTPYHLWQYCAVSVLTEINRQMRE